MITLKSEIRTCAFIDVLGYGNIVMSTDSSTEKKLQMLESIFKNLHSSIAYLTLKGIKSKHGDKKELFIKSFSDSFFIESDEAYTVLFALYNIFSVTFGYYTNFAFEQHCTVLLRAGIVKDWTLKIMDVGSLSRQPIEEMFTNDEFKNIIGLGVARAYYTSEKSYVSGMRIVISPEVLECFELIPYEEVSFECYYVEGENLLFSSDLPNDNEIVKLFFLPIRQNEKGETVNLYELCWPVYKYSWSPSETNIHTFVNEIIKIEPEYKPDNIRHLRKTAELLYKSFEIATTINMNTYSVEDIKFAKEKLKAIAGI